MKSGHFEPTALAYYSAVRYQQRMGEALFDPVKAQFDFVEFIDQARDVIVSRDDGEGGKLRAIACSGLLFSCAAEDKSDAAKLAAGVKDGMDAFKRALSIMEDPSKGIDLVPSILDINGQLDIMFRNMQKDRLSYYSHPMKGYGAK